MTAAWLLTGLAVLGVVIGALLGESRTLSVHLAAAGGGLLVGISLFWLIPEIAESSGGVLAVAVPIGLAAGFWVADRRLFHASHPLRHGYIATLMGAAALHSVLDGWSIRAVEIQPMASLIVLLGLALHKLPEGLALGWITRNSLQSMPRAVAFCSAAEMLTVAGAWIEPRVASLNVTLFGARSAGAVLMLVAASFLFLGSHAVVADRKKSGIVPAFLGALSLAGLMAVVRHTKQ
jgi:zinc transporter ZupT